MRKALVITLVALAAEIQAIGISYHLHFSLSTHPLIIEFNFRHGKHAIETGFTDNSSPLAHSQWFLTLDPVTGAPDLHKV